ncbi:MAG: DUF3052 family protein [Myxococcaceae bacterium]|nr:MAG: DUF3052 family protein [Myxococcaceae bacterium]
MTTPYAFASLAPTLGIRAGTKVSIINPPRGFVQKLNPLPDGVEFLVTAQTGLDVILFFTTDATELVQRLPALSRATTLNGGIWVCWATAEGPRTHLSEDFVRHAALDIGLVDNKICVIDETWTALRLVRRPRGKLDKPEGRKQAPAQA